MRKLNHSFGVFHRSLIAYALFFSFCSVLTCLLQRAGWVTGLLNNLYPPRSAP